MTDPIDEGINQGAGTADNANHAFLPRERLANRCRPESQNDGITVVELLKSLQPKGFEPLSDYGLIFWPDPGRTEIGECAISNRITQRANAAPNVRVGFEKLNIGSGLK
ncbi:hypothetical protein BOA8489_03859 [Boseongicola aestuarii]|uniref:Uncharacterized protein n=1 Tax=Boseongicola aestuarii TaxID=1470561 RepID=A0A238J6E2_9RHOB|nr:hypothetical protein BOA8489_03859 [Boseongicola aestuarii]